MTIASITNQASSWDIFRCERILRDQCAPAKWISSCIQSTELVIRLVAAFLFTVIHR